VAQTAIEIPASTPPPAEIGSFISVTGTLTTEEKLGDDRFLAPGNYVALERTSQMYAWEEDSETETRTNTGGSETRTTTYTYRKSWQENPENSSSFERPEGHENPEKQVSSERFHVSLAKIGQYGLDFQTLRFPTPSDVPLSAENLLPDSGATQSGQYLFLGEGTLSDPKVGDIRITYESLNPGINATVFGELAGNNTIASHLGPRNISIYRLFPGSRAEAIATLATEHKILTWVLRGGGFLMMWIGMGMVFEPLSVLLDVLPILGNVSRGAIGFITFITALVLSIVTILVSIILHNPIMVFLAVGFSGFAVFWAMRNRKKS
jgi:hypothetical protein